MTIPSLMNNYQRQSYVSQLHKFYNEMSQAVLQYQTEQNALNLREAGLTSQTNANDFFKTHFKVISDCGSDFIPCFAAQSSYKYMNGNLVGPDSRGSHFVLASGSSVRLEYRPIITDFIMEIFVDVNGQKGPNVVGRDMFAMYLYNNGVIDDHHPTKNGLPLTRDEREESFNIPCLGNMSGNWYGCFGKILNDNWQMTY